MSMPQQRDIERLVSS